MTLLFGANIALQLFAWVFGPVHFTRAFKLGWLNPVTIPMIAFLPIALVTNFSGPAFLLDQGLFNPYFQYALLVDNVYRILATVATIVLVRKLTRHRALSVRVRRFLEASPKSDAARMRIAGMVFLGLFLVSFLLLTRHSFGLANWIVQPRTGYQFHRTGAGHWWALCVTLLSVSVVLATTYARSTHQVILLAPVYLLCVYLLGSKGSIIVFALYFVVILTIRRYRHLKLVTLVVVGAAAALVVSNFASAMGGFGLEELSSYADHYVNAAMFYQQYLGGELPLFKGEIMVSSFWSLVPRAVYPDKPYVYGIIKVVELFYPGGAEQTSTPAFATVETFADFGWPQVVASALLGPGNLVTAFLYASVLPRLGAFNVRRNLVHTRRLFYTYLLLVAPALFQSFGFPSNIVLFGIIAAVIGLCHRLRVARGATTPPLTRERIRHAS